MKLINYCTDLFTKMMAGCLTVMIFYFIISLILGFFVSILWNMIMPIIFGVIYISYWQGFILMILCCLLFSRININYKK